MVIPDQVWDVLVKHKDQNDFPAGILNEAVPLTRWPSKPRTCPLSPRGKRIVTTSRDEALIRSPTNPGNWSRALKVRAQLSSWVALIQRTIGALRQKVLVLGIGLGQQR